jgi:hypothetical protein
MKNLPWIILYTFINTLFVYKYADMVTPHHLVPSLLYPVAISGYLLLHHRLSLREGGFTYSKATRVLVIGGSAIALYLMMKQIDPTTLAVGRYPALNDWIERFLNGDFPYRAQSRPSGFPFLFLLAIPFHSAGEIGLIHILSFLIFATIILRGTTGLHPVDEIHRIVVLVSSPIFLYELVVRSDLFTNMVLVLLYITVLEISVRRDTGPFRLALLGIAGGCILATRIIVVLIFLLVMIADFRERGLKSMWLILGNIIGFVGITLPFLVWDSGYFLTEGPFSIQVSYMSMPTALPILLLAVIFSVRSSSRKNVISCIAILLFAAVFLPFLQSIYFLGWDQVIFDDGFDISYFMFCLPFLVLSLHPDRRSPA